MNKLIFLSVLGFGITISCSNPTKQENAKGEVTQTTTVSEPGQNNKNMNTQKITPYLWVEKDAKAVADYYLSIFKDG
ncbi:MAG: hypothetical protein JNM88_10055, partial [Chitinophagaceae bacterium]|nr:hypothetical protein [Chitinophagaceae bacterium]